jgi:hypothetical protein
MKNLRKLFAVTLLVLTFALPAYADGQIETPKPSGAPVKLAKPLETPLTQDDGSYTSGTQSGQIETPMTIMLSVIESVLALI